MIATSAAMSATSATTLAAVIEMADNGLRLPLNEGERGSEDDLPG